MIKCDLFTNNVVSFKSITNKSRHSQITDGFHCQLNFKYNFELYIENLRTSNINLFFVAKLCCYLADMS